MSHAQPVAPGIDSLSRLDVTLRPVSVGDREFLFRLYASTRAEEKSLSGWDDSRWEEFLRMQFHLQQTQYRQNYRNPSFDLILVGRNRAGRLYMDRSAEEIRIIDMSLLPEYRRRGIGAGLMTKITQEADAIGAAVTLHVEKNNLASKLYWRLGFRIIADHDLVWFMERRPLTKGKGAEQGHLPN